MVRTDPLAADADVDVTVERTALALECEDVRAIATAVFEHVGDDVAHQYGHEVAVVTALRVATDRGSDRVLDLERACTVVGVDPRDVASAEAMVSTELGPPAADEEQRSLRRAIIAVHELLAAVETDRTNAPRLPLSVLADVGPALAGVATRPLEEIDETELRAHLDCLEADLEMARLGVHLYALTVEERVRVERKAETETETTVETEREGDPAPRDDLEHDPTR